MERKECGVELKIGSKRKRDVQAGSLPWRNVAMAKLRQKWLRLRAVNSIRPSIIGIALRYLKEKT
jgi:hypothetical protein